MAESNVMKTETTNFIFLWFYLFIFSKQTKMWCIECRFHVIPVKSERKKLLKCVFFSLLSLLDCVVILWDPSHPASINRFDAGWKTKQERSTQAGAHITHSASVLWQSNSQVVMVWQMYFRPAKSSDKFRLVTHTFRKREKKECQGRSKERQALWRVFFYAYDVRK